MDIHATLEDVAQKYPSGMVADQRRDIRRIAYSIQLALNGAVPAGLAICDIGGGLGLFSPSCAALGMRAAVVDDFNDPVNSGEGERALDVHRHYGVRIIQRDVVKDGLADIGEKFDIVTSFDSMEHWHHSPKELFRQVATTLLKPGGRLVLGVPNCVNLRKRITVPLGRGKWSSMHDWYEQPTFRGHVREPDCDDLRYIARDIGLRDVKIVGQNWIGHLSSSKAIRVATKIIDRPLRLFPSLCADLYLTGST